MGGLAGLFNSGQAGVLLNVGALVQPTTRANYDNPDRTRYPLPPQLMSHNDQQSVWQAQDAEGATTGWGGAIGDIALNNNAQSLFTCVSAAGNAVFLSGQSAAQYQISTAGAIPIRAAREGLYYSASQARAAAALTELLTLPRAHVLENEYARLTRRAIEAEARVSSALAGATVNTAFPDKNSLADQLRIVARMIAARGALGTKRQVFLVSLV